MSKMKILPRYAPYVNGRSMIKTSYGLLKCIGRGRFTCAYVNQRSGNLYLFVSHGDLCKDIISHVNRPNKHIPPMVYLGRETYGKRDYDLYCTKRYKIMTPDTCIELHPHLRAFNEAHQATCDKFRGNLIKGDRCVKFNEHLIKIVKLPMSYKVALRKLSESAKDWGQFYLFDTLRWDNVGLDENNTLVFIDPMFDAKKIHESQVEQVLGNLREC